MMKHRKTILEALTLTVIFLVSCGKNIKTGTSDLPGPAVNYSDVNLRDKPLDTIRKAIMGCWKIHYSMILGWAGWITHTDSIHFISFLSNDTLKRESDGAVMIYEKSIIKKKIANKRGHGLSIYL